MRHSSATFEVGLLYLVCLLVTYGGASACAASDDDGSLDFSGGGGGPTDAGAAADGSQGSGGRTGAGGSIAGSGGAVAGRGGAQGFGGASQEAGTSDDGGGFLDGGGFVDAGGPGDDAGSPTGSCDNACCPLNDSCYIAGNPGSGAECLAQHENVPSSRIQMRRSWVKWRSPLGFASGPLARLFSTGSELPWPECGTPAGTGAALELFELDRTDPSPDLHTARTGFAARVTNLGDVRDDGLCAYGAIYDDPLWSLASGLGGINSFTSSSIGPKPRAQPWSVEPTRLRAVEEDFDVSAERDALFQSLQRDGTSGGVFFYDPARGRYHAYSLLTYATLHETPARTLSIPLHEVETVRRFNDPSSPNCMSALAPADCIDSADAGAPACGFENCDAPAASTSQAYALIVELEQIYSETLGATLCAAAPTLEQSIADGFADPQSWGLNCRGAPSWQPDDDAAGLPRGDWCSRTNGPATNGCHDAYRVIVDEAFSAFPVREGVCEERGAPTAPVTACPGEALTLSPGQAQRVTSQGETLQEQTGRYCGTGPDSGAIYAVTGAADGTLFVDAVAALGDDGQRRFDGLLYVQRSCGESATTTTCAASDAAGPHVAVAMSAGQTVYVFLQTSSDFDAIFRLEPPRCGDGVRGGSEECDFGDRRVGDGCDESCSFEPLANDAGDRCAGRALGTLTRGSPINLAGPDLHTVGFTDDYDAPCRARTGAADRVFHVTPDQSGRLRVEVEANFDVVVSVYRGCPGNEPQGLLGCSDGPRAADSEVVSVPVQASRTYFIVVDGYMRESSGAFRLNVSLDP